MGGGDLGPHVVCDIAQITQVLGGTQEGFLYGASQSEHQTRARQAGGAGWPDGYLPVVPPGERCKQHVNPERFSGIADRDTQICKAFESKLHGVAMDPKVCGGVGG